MRFGPTMVPDFRGDTLKRSTLHDSSRLPTTAGTYAGSTRLGL